jgi:hypothetical protein
MIFVIFHIHCLSSQELYCGNQSKNFGEINYYSPDGVGFQ